MLITIETDELIKLIKKNHFVSGTLGNVVIWQNTFVEDLAYYLEKRGAYDCTGCISLHSDEPCEECPSKFDKVKFATTCMEDKKDMCDGISI